MEQFPEISEIDCVLINNSNLEVLNLLYMTNIRYNKLINSSYFLDLIAKNLRVKVPKSFRELYYFGADICMKEYKYRDCIKLAFENGRYEFITKYCYFTGIKLSYINYTHSDPLEVINNNQLIKIYINAIELGRVVSGDYSERVTNMLRDRISSIDHSVIEDLINISIKTYNLGLYLRAMHEIDRLKSDKLGTIYNSAANSAIKYNNKSILKVIYNRAKRINLPKLDYKRHIILARSMNHSDLAKFIESYAQ